MIHRALIALCLISSFTLFASAPPLYQGGVYQASSAPSLRSGQAAPKIEQELRDEEQAEGETCAICLQELYVKDKPTQTLLCKSRNPQALNHTFHTTCIGKWFERDKRCVICRTPIPEYEIQAHNPDAPIDVQRRVQLRLGDMHFVGGNGIPKNYAAALPFLRQASIRDANNPDAPVDVQRWAQLRLGEIYYFGGNGISQNFATALPFLTQANNPDAPTNVQRAAQLHLGDIHYLGGNGISQNYATALPFLMQANNPDALIDVQRWAQLCLGDIHFLGGNGIPQNFATALPFLTKANNPDDAPVDVQRLAQLRLGQIHSLGGDGIARDSVQAKQFLNLANQEDAPVWVQEEAQLQLKKNRSSRACTIQ